jgi:acetylornithine deacetylase/succinyl-diaminopimelate desuccinylase-like protein
MTDRFERELRAYLDDARDRLVDDLARFIAIPSVSRGYEEGIAGAVDFLSAEFEAADLACEVCETAGNPIVLADSGPADGPTMLVYGHYDVFPPGDASAWNSDPFEATRCGDELYGRGAGDNKGQVLAHIKAIAALRRLGEMPPIQIRFLVEGEEEVGSPSLHEFVAERRDQLRSDVCFYSDGPMLPDDQPAVIFGVRGALCVAISATGARRDLHSGNFGGVAPTPLMDLCRLLSELTDRSGELAPELREGVSAPTAGERAALHALPLARGSVAAELGVAPDALPAGEEFFERIMCRPVLNVCGVVGGYAGDGIRPAIPHEASARVDIRLVGDQDPDRLLDALRDFASRRGYDNVAIERISGYPGSRTPLDHPFGALVRDAVARGFGREPCAVPSLGGTTPEYLFTRVLGCPTVMVPYAPHDESNHAPNERTKVSTYLGGIRTTAHLVRALGGIGATALGVTSTPTEE